MGALWIAHVTVTDDEAYAKYAALATEAIAAHGGHFIARGAKFVQLEGQARPRNVVARFEAERVPPFVGEAARLAHTVAAQDEQARA